MNLVEWMTEVVSLHDLSTEARQSIFDADGNLLLRTSTTGYSAPSVQDGFGTSGRASNRPGAVPLNGTASAGLSGGFGAGCSAGVKWTWK